MSPRAVAASMEGRGNGHRGIPLRDAIASQLGVVAAQIDERALGFQLSAAAGARVGFHGTGGTVSVVRFGPRSGSISAPLRVDEALPPLPSWTLGLRAGVAGDLL